jgi:ATP-dependent Clp protease adaptor protein ClpS
MNNVQLSEMPKKNLKPITRRGRWWVVLHNDNHNTFEDVTNALMDVCGYAYLSAVQCAVITHEAGRCKVWEDIYDECEQVYKYLRELGLRVSLEKCSGSKK